jgi:hypothetical protein
MKGKVRPDREVITYCRIGERSSHAWFALTVLLGYATCLTTTNPGPITASPLACQSSSAGAKTGSPAALTANFGSRNQDDQDHLAEGARSHACDPRV